LVQLRKTCAKRLAEIAMSAAMVGKTNQASEKYRVVGVTSDSFMRLQKT